MRYASQVEAITTECRFCTIDGKKVVVARCSLWDTGSTSTILSRRLIDELQPEPFRKGGISGIGGETEGNTYLLHVLLPTGDACTNMEVLEADLGDYDAIIGMDIITLGDFRISSTADETIFTFEVAT